MIKWMMNHECMVNSYNIFTEQNNFNECASFIAEQNI